MTRPTPAATGRTGRRTLGLLVALAVVATAGAPSVITIRSGDTLWDIARAHGTTISALKALNDLPGNGTIYAGERLRVPGSGSGSATRGRGTGEVSYTVRSGETLGHIALRFGVSQQTIATRNRLSQGRVYAGQHLAIPGAVRGATGSVPTTNAGKRIPDSVRNAAAENRRILAGRSLPSKAQVRRMVAATAHRYGVPASLALAVAYHESGFQQRVVSGVNAIGVMQVLPSTARVLSRSAGHDLDLLKTSDNITAGVLLLRELLRSTPTTDRALAGYYQGLGSIARQGLLPQTHSYIASIHILRARFENG